MIDYLIEREREENFRTSTRILTFPGGEPRRIETYRIVWAWFDRALAYEFGPSESDILTTAIDCAEEESLPLDQALGRVLNYFVRQGEASGLDYTDDNVPLMLAKQGIRRFYAKRSNE